MAVHPLPNVALAARKVGLIGLGAGALAVYGRPGDLYRFYEINPQVMEIAVTEFSFMRNRQAKIETVLGDARLILEQEPSNHFDVLAVDAFSGDRARNDGLLLELMIRRRQGFNGMGA